MGTSEKAALCSLVFARQACYAHGGKGPKAPCIPYNTKGFGDLSPRQSVKMPARQGRAEGIYAGGENPWKLCFWESGNTDKDRLFSAFQPDSRQPVAKHGTGINANPVKLQFRLSARRVAMNNNFAMIFLRK